MCTSPALFDISDRYKIVNPWNKCEIIAFGIMTIIHIEVSPLFIVASGCYPGYETRSNIVQWCICNTRFSVQASDELHPVLPPYLDVFDLELSISILIYHPNIHLSGWATLVGLSISPSQKIGIAVFVKALLAIFKLPLFLINKLRFNICRVFEKSGVLQVFTGCKLWPLTFLEI